MSKTAENRLSAFAGSGFWVGRFGAGSLIAVLLLLVVEAWLHSDSFLYQYRSVFAAGRAMDKVIYVEKERPNLLIAGNSRIDNGIDPKILTENSSVLAASFNLGVPGINMRALYGIFKRFADKDIFSSGGVNAVLIGLDETMFQSVDALGYSVVFGDREKLLEYGEWKELLASWIRLWGYSDSLKGLREPAKLERFIKATCSVVEPVGGAASEYHGYRANYGSKFQNAEQVRMQMAGTKEPPDPTEVAYLWNLLDLLEDQNISVAIVFPPLLNRNVLFLSPEEPEAGPYIKIMDQLRDRGLPIIALGLGDEKYPYEFSNPGHLNDIGAKKYTKVLSAMLKQVWVTHSGM